MLIGAGTVLTTADVDRLNDVGGKLMVSPNVDTQVLARAHQYAMVTLPGVFSPTEALLAGALRRIGPEILSGERARRVRHCRDPRRAAGRRR